MRALNGNFAGVVSLALGMICFGADWIGEAWYKSLYVIGATFLLIAWKNALMEKTRFRYFVPVMTYIAIGSIIGGVYAADEEMLLKELLYTFRSIALLGVGIIVLLEGKTFSMPVRMTALFWTGLGIVAYIGYQSIYYPLWGEVVTEFYWGQFYEARKWLQGVSCMLMAIGFGVKGKNDERVHGAV